MPAAVRRSVLRLLQLPDAVLQAPGSALEGRDHLR
eukprot:CAMPEP_0206007030 /NCGR_PEP_ID=MMETSP1464-20131121/5519_1 /ASSEMBLY_ACC=CAM_ASM_001124 /TAXON_ID=119497 /ORGANISM="Exanthemachrysis gayraliae, Strain RCC1523" /LENGTH=34 /DNA_ID= /DNA_START= /DNA_END= /DNA_ORIENTATION=